MNKTQKGTKWETAAQFPFCRLPTAYLVLVCCSRDSVSPPKHRGRAVLLPILPNK